MRLVIVMGYLPVEGRRGWVSWWRLHVGPGLDLASGGLHGSVQGIHGAVEVVLGDGQGRAEAQALLAAPEHHHALVADQAGTHVVTHAARGQVDGAHQPAAAGVVEAAVPVLQVLEACEQVGAEPTGAVDQPVALHDLEHDRGPDHVDQRPAEGRVDPAGGPPHVVGLVVEAATAEHPAHVGLLAVGEQVGLDAELLVGPRGAGHPDAGLDLVDDEQGLVLAAQVLHALQEPGGEVAVAPLPLDGFGDEAGDVVRVGGERVGRGGQRDVLVVLVRLGVGLQREPQGRRRDPRPVEGREPRRLDRVGVGEAQGVARAAVEGVAQVQDPRPERRVPPRRLVAPALPVERRLEGVGDGGRPTLDHEVPGQPVGAQHAGEGVDVVGLRDRVDVGVGRLVPRGLQQARLDVGVVHRRVVHAQRVGREEREHVQVRGAGACVDQGGPVAAVEVEDEVVPVHQHVLSQAVQHIVGLHGSTSHAGVVLPRRR